MKAPRASARTALETDDSTGPITHLGPGGKVPKELHDLLTPVSLSLAGANIIMQLAQLPVGHGVAESKVESGALYMHPIKRARTTFGYVMIAVFGTDDDRVALGAAVTDVHRHVRSDPGEPVRYSALDPKLQLWVAACMYRGFEESYSVLYGSPPPELLDLMYRHSARLATTLQVPATMWPPDREAFEAYWAEAEATIEMDEVTRAYLYDFAGLGFLPWPIPLLCGWFHRAITAGFLEEPFRKELGLSWGRLEQRAFAVNNVLLRTVNSLTPRRIRTLPFDLYLWDMRRRIRDGRRLV